MKPKEIHLSDLTRILMGEAPWSFAGEVLIRIGFILILLLIMMRLMGKRMASMLSLQEMAILVSLAAAIGVPMQAPDRGLLPAVIVSLFALALHRGIGFMAYKNRKAEILTEGEASIIVAEGIFLPDNLKRAGISRERASAQLRSMDIVNLGAVERLYFEANGSFSLVPASSPKPGLSIVPVKDPEYMTKQKKISGHFSCQSCGYTLKHEINPAITCSRCHARCWGACCL
jgi:uncharacterized membrane protein YcaP (DUF421 family)